LRGYLLGADGDDILRGGVGPDELQGDDIEEPTGGGDGADSFYGGPVFDKCSGNTGPDSAEAATCEQTPSIESLL
jgi:Ca2+-binding RTX toxin-like protein